VMLGTFYGIGVGPGDPELITLKGVSTLARCRHVLVPKPGRDSSSVALSIARQHLRPDAEISELLFPMISDSKVLDPCWEQSARQVANVLVCGEDACFLTLGDPLLYSTYIYLLRALKRLIPNAPVVTVPGIMAFAAAAALTSFPMGEGKNTVSIIPTADDLNAVRRALVAGGTVVLMKIGARLPRVIELLEEHAVLDRAVFVARAGLDGQYIETDLRKLRQAEPKVGYLSLMLVHASREATT
jgi:precorrin-2/cobalt-factor-2 C20-methyltransferase